MRIEHATLEGKIFATELPDEPLSARPAEPAVPSIESLAAALQVIAERVGMSKGEAETLVRPTSSSAPSDRA